MITLTVKLRSTKEGVNLLVERVVPTAEAVMDVTPEAGLELVKAIHGVMRIRGGRDAKHVILGAACLLRLADGLPL